MTPIIGLKWLLIEIRASSKKIRYFFFYFFIPKKKALTLDYTFHLLQNIPFSWENS